MIVITGAAGFIGSNMVSRLNENGFNDLILVDNFSRTDKRPNWENTKYSSLVAREDFFEWLIKNKKNVQIIVHLGARTDTAESDVSIFDKLNLNYSKRLWSICTEYQIPFLYASSAATYGDGSLGFDDKIRPEILRPLNPYGRSKNDFDAFVLAQNESPFFWAGFKFFNVYGPNENHKGRMASVVYHAIRQIRQNNTLKLFRSHRSDFLDGEQKRDFISVFDVVDILFYFMETRKKCGLYNVGTGNAKSFNELAQAVFVALEKPAQIEYIDTPLDIRETYQYFTEAKVEKLQSAGYNSPFTNLEDGVKNYVKRVAI